jgi:predicted lipoprotein with Yx(FWY)xxD motif
MRTTLVLLAAALAIAGGAYAATRHTATAMSAAASKHATVKTRKGALGTFLVDGKGRTLYRFMKDTGRRSMCSGACAQAWPPQTTRGRPTAAGHAKAALLSTVRRAGGARQVDYAGHPLYRYSLDTGPGTTSGQGIDAFGGHWYVVGTSGRAIRGAAPAGGGTPARGGYGY